MLIVLSILLFVMTGINKQPMAPSRYIFLVLSLVILLIAGITTPIIDMEATISQMNFELMGAPSILKIRCCISRAKAFWMYSGS